MAFIMSSSLSMVGMQTARMEDPLTQMPPVMPANCGGSLRRSVSSGLRSMHMLLSMNSSLPVMTTPFLSSASTTQPCSMRLRKQTRKRFYVEAAILFSLSGPYYYNQLMLGEESTVFPKQIKIDDYSPYEPGNVISILESSNLLLGSGARTSNAAIVLAKTLHFLSEEGAFELKGKTVLDLGCGVGFVGIYLACLGCQVVLADFPSLKDLVERNMGINKSLFRGKVDFTVVNWKNGKCIGKCEEMNEVNSTTSSQKQECLFHLMEKIDLTIICEGGGLGDLENHLRWLGREGLILCFLERGTESEEFLTWRTLEKRLIQKQLNYERLDQLHPDYSDDRVIIYHIWK